jgi:two-component system LytT family sensor kinase
MAISPMRTIKSKQKIIQRHVLTWALFILYEVSVSLSLGAEKGFWGYFPYYILHIALFYTYAHVILNFVWDKKQRWLYLIPLTILLLVVYLTLISLVRSAVVFFHLTNEKSAFSLQTFIGSVWRGIYFLLISSTYWMVNYLIDRNKRINELELQQITAEKNKYKLENAYLMTQMNPHLLFNSLNFIYNSVRKVSPETAKSVVILSDIMRHALSEPDQDGLIHIQEEIDHISKLIEICRLRFQDKFHLQFICDEEVDDIKIPPLILVTIVENLLKHGDLTDKLHPALIEIGVNARQINLVTRNLIKDTQLQYSTRIGLKNTKLRLKSHFREDNFKLDLWEKDNIYNVKLTINL